MLLAAHEPAVHDKSQAARQVKPWVCCNKTAACSEPGYQTATLNAHDIVVQRAPVALASSVLLELVPAGQKDQRGRSASRIKAHWPAGQHAPSLPPPRESHAIGAPSGGHLRAPGAVLTVQAHLLGLFHVVHIVAYMAAETQRGGLRNG